MKCQPDKIWIYILFTKNVLASGLGQMHAKRKENDKQKWGGGASQMCVSEAIQQLALSSSRKTRLLGAEARSGSQLENEDTAETEP